MSIRTWIAPPPPAAPATATASSTAPSKRRAACTASVGPADRRRIDEYLESIREVERGLERFQGNTRRRRGRHRTAFRHAGRLRRAFAPDVPPAGPGPAGRPHPRHHHDGGPGIQHPRLRSNRHPRIAPSTVAPSQRSGRTRQTDQDSNLPPELLRRIHRPAPGHPGRRRDLARPLA